MARFQWRQLIMAAVVVVCFGLTSAFLGCSNQPARPKTYPVHGTVTFNGTPVEGATVTFVPKEGATGNPKPQAASAITDSSGRYSIGTFATGDGAVPGDYLVKVTKYRVTQQQQAGNDPESQMQAFLQHQQGAQQQAGPKNELPVKYENEKTSGLFLTVQPGDNTFDINLQP